MRIATLTLVFLLTGLMAAAAQDTGSLERVEYETAEGTTAYRRLITRQETDDRTLETWLVETASMNGGYGTLLEIEEETVRVNESTTRITRQHFIADANGARALLERVDEERVEDASGRVNIVRDISQLDANGRSQRTRRETETTTPGPNGTFETEIQVLRPGINRSGFVPTEQVIETGRNDTDGRVLESDRTTYSDSSGSGNWMALERRITTNEYNGEEVATVENVYRQDPNGDLTLNEQISSREWVDAAGRMQMTEDVYSTDIPGQRLLREPRLLRQVSSSRAESPDGGWEFTREVRESRQGRFRVVELERETARANRSGGMDVERVVERLDANGRLVPVETTTSSETR